MQQDREVLRDFGIKVNNGQLDETLKLIGVAHKEELERIKSAKKQNTEENFLKNLLGGYRDKVEAKNNKIVYKEHTYLIRAVDPEDIQSITERAYFNSFNLQRHKNTELFQTQVQESQSNVLYNNVAPVEKVEAKEPEIVVDDKQQCSCGNKIDGASWVMCDNRQNCKGTMWYHYCCVGIKQGDNIEGQTFICPFCKQIDENPEPGKRKIPKV